MRSVALKKKAAAQTGPLHDGSTEYHSSGNSELDPYNMESPSAIEKHFPIITQHFGIELLAGAA